MSGSLLIEQGRQSGRLTMLSSLPRVRQSAPWYLSYNVLYDLLISIASTYHLAKSAGAPFGLSNISRTLFYNNIHYVRRGLVLQRE